MPRGVRFACMGSSGLDSLLRAADHQLGFRAVLLVDGHSNPTLIAENPAPVPPSPRLVSTGDKPDLRVGAGSIEWSDHQTRPYAIHRVDRYLNRLPPLHHKWRLRHQDRPRDSPLQESTESRKGCLLSGSEITSGAIDAESADRICKLPPVARAARPKHCALTSHNRAACAIAASSAESLSDPPHPTRAKHTTTVMPTRVHATVPL
jgi:hypothetical protein